MTRLFRKKLQEIAKDAGSGVIIRQAKVLTVTPGTPYKISVDMGGSLTITNVVCMSHVWPIVNEGVWIMALGSGRWIAIGISGSAVFAGLIGSARFQHATSITGVTDLTNMQATFTALTGARYKISWSVCFLQNTTAGVVNAGLYDATNAVSIDYPAVTTPAGSYCTFGGVVPVTPAAGSITYKLRAQTSAGSIDMATMANMIVERIL